MNKHPFTTAIREYFPVAVTPERIIVLILILICIHLLCGCSSSKPLSDVQIVTAFKHDTLYASNMQYDSIYIYQERISDYHRSNLKSLETAEIMKPDTLYIKDASIEYRYKFLRDTIRIVKVDSIPVIQTVTVTEHKLYKPLYLTIFAWIGSFTVGYFIVNLIIFIIKLYKR